MKTITLFSQHLFHSYRRAGFHFLADSFAELGWQVRFVTVDFSLLSRLRPDRRLVSGKLPAFNRLETVSERTRAGALATILHPVGHSRSLLGRFLDRVTSCYPDLGTRFVEDAVAGSDLVIVESASSLLLLGRIRAACKAPIIYRVSDDLTVVRPVPSLLAAERAAIPHLDAISLASPELARRFATGPVRIDPVGVDKRAFSRIRASPFVNDGVPNVVNSGSTGLDFDAVEAAAASCPHLRFYQFGSLRRPIRAPNVVAMGETPLDAVIAYVQHADFGFAPYAPHPGYIYQAEHSNRLQQYAFYALPSIVPAALCRADAPHLVGYDPHDLTSLGPAFARAATIERQALPACQVHDWRDLAQRLSEVTPRAMR